MPRRNRVDPWGDLHTVPARGLLTGNRGCLVDDHGKVVRHHASSLWIACRTSFRGWSHPLDAPRRWTPIFFLDDAVALAAGHRPCATCRRDDYSAYRDAVGAAGAWPGRLLASDLDRLLALERLERGRGIERARDRKLWPADITDLPDGTVVIDHAGALMVLGAELWQFSFAGWTALRPRPTTGAVAVLTPPTSVGALRNGFRPLLHASARGKTAEFPTP